MLVWPNTAHTSFDDNQPIIQPVADTTKPVIESAKGRYMFSGTIVLDRTVSRDARVSGGYDYSQPFGGMADFGKLDAAVADLECPVTSRPFPPSAQIEVPSPKFNCLPGWLPELKKYFPIINLSSNHTYDRGADGFAETLKNLDAAGFQVVGNYTPHADKDNCRILSLPVRLVDSDGQPTKGILPIAFCSFNYKILFSPEPGELEKIKDYQAVMPVFGMLNAGSEYRPSAGTTQINLAHKMIDYGAEFVIGNGTHWVQNTEAYKGRLITYSLGNFIFDQADAESRRSANIILNLSANYDDNLAGWLTLGTECQANPDHCLELIQASGLKKPDLQLKFSVIAAEGGFNSVTHKANTSLQKAVEERLDWANTEAGLTTR